MRPPQSWSRARVTLGIALLTVATYALPALSGLYLDAVAWGAFIPADLAVDFAFARAPFWLTPLTATLLHFNLIHLVFNLLILVFCGRPTENVLGPVSLAILYVVGAYAAAAGHYLMGPSSLAPMIGASGADSAVLGAYAILFGRNKVKIRNPRLAVWLNALWLMAAWVGLQAIVGVLTAGFNLQIAIGAHIGGFLAGVLLAYPLLMLRYRKA